MTLIAKRIIEARKINGLTQEELAEKAQINLRTIQRIENNENEPRGKTLNLICNVLKIDVSELISSERLQKKNSIEKNILDIIFLVILNLVLIGIIGFLTLDSKANINSLFGGVLLSFFLPFFIVVLTKNMRGVERMLKFGFGYFVYFLSVMIFNGFPTGFVTGLFPCMLISLLVLYYGSEIIKKII